MEKEAQADSMMATVTIKPEYPPSEVYSTEPPPAYHRAQSSAVQVAKIIAVTVVLVSVVLGSFILASAYVTANASCRQLEQEFELMNEVSDRFQAPLQPEALVQEEAHKKAQDLLAAQSAKKGVKSEIDDNRVDAVALNGELSSATKDGADESSDSSENSNESNDSEPRLPIQFRLPLQLDFDDLAGALMDKNQRSRMNCVVEKKKAEQVVDHQAKTVALPFGVNMTTDPRYEHLSGERMVIFCESGNIQSRRQPEETHHDDTDEDAIMIQPVMIPIPPSPYATHMAQQQMPQPQAAMFKPQPSYGSMTYMRPPMPPQQQQQLQPQPHSQAQFLNDAVVHQITQQIIAQKIVEAQRARQEQLRQEQMRQEQVRQEQMRQEHLRQEHFKLMQQEQQQRQQQASVLSRIPIPMELLTQLNRLPNREVIVAVQQQVQTNSDEDSDNDDDESDNESPSTNNNNNNNNDEDDRSAMMIGRQSYGRDLPVDIPFRPILQPQQPQQPQEPQPMPIQTQHLVRQQPMQPVTMPHQPQQQTPAQTTEENETTEPATEEARPHYVQPRSVRSVRSVESPFKVEKRMKRCSCNCAC